MKQVFEATRETKMQESMITKTSRVRLVRVIDTPVVLSHNRRTRDEHGNTYVQEGLTSW
jgi:hypothetical protein